MQILKQSTATTVYVGPVLDSAGAAVTTAGTGDFRLVKNGTAATLSGATATHDANGYYTIALTTSNTDTVGRLTIGVGNTAMSMATHRYTVLLASVFDALLTNATNSSGGLVTATAAITGLSGVIATTTNITSATGIVLSATTHTGATIPTVTTVTNRVSANTDQWGGVTVTGMPMPTYTQPTGFLAATFPATVASTTNITTVGAVSGSVGSVTGNVGGSVSGSVGSISGVTFPGNFGSLAITVGGAVTAGTVSDKTGYTLSASGLASITAWTVAITGNITGNLSGSVGSVTGAVGSVAAGVTVATNNDKTGYSLATAPLDASGTAAAVWGALLTSYTTAGTFGARVVRSTNSNNSVAITGANHVAADIHELQPAVIQATHFDLGAIDANALAADAASEIATSVWSAATRTLTAFSFAITVDAASIRSAIGMAAANLDTQLDAIPTAAEIDTQLTASHGAGSWAVGGTGSGAFTLTITVNDGTNPLQNATVRMVEGVNAYVGQTNASGVVAFSLDAATYNVAITKDGYSFTPTTKVVSATGSQTYSMSQITPTLPAAAGLSTGTAVCYGTTGLPIAGVVVTIQQVDGKGVAGSAYDGDTFTLTSNAQGVISHNGFVRGAVYSIRRGIRGEVKSFTVPDAASFDLSEIVGRD